MTTDQGEGRYVTIRGIDAALSNVTIDGQIIGSPEGDTRRVALDTVPADILSKLEVIKSATPDLDGNAIGGTINLITPSVFDDPDGSFFSATGDYGYYDLGGQNPWGGSVGWGNIFNERFGIVLSGSYSDREFNSHNVQGGDPWVEEGDFLVPDEFTMRDYLIRRVRKGFVANLEFRPNDDVKFHWRNLVQPLRGHRAAAGSDARLPQRRSREPDSDFGHLHRGRGRAHQHQALRDPVHPVLDARRRLDPRRLERGGLRDLRRDQAGHALRQRLSSSSSTASCR